MAAGQIIVREAGGTVSGVAGDDDALKTGHVNIFLCSGR